VPLKPAVGDGSLVYRGIGLSHVEKKGVRGKDLLALRSVSRTERIARAGVRQVTLLSASAPHTVISSAHTYDTRSVSDPSLSLS
jgi:hypothetical protein